MNSAYKTHTLAFYNIENLFDTIDDEETKDDDFLPTSAKRWTEKRYQNKLMKISSVISKIGIQNDNEHAPVLVGLAEVENRHVLSDLVSHKNLIEEGYSYVHYDSSDERGIDVALLYKGDEFKVDYSETFSVYLENEEGMRDYTRDILLVKGQLHKETIYILVNHWSSRRDGADETEVKRLAAAGRVNNIITNIKAEDSEAKIIVMGDFNDNPNDKSVILMEKESQLFNPFKTVWTKNRGSLNHNFTWYFFDQILFSTNFFDAKNSTLAFDMADVYDDKSLTQYRGKYKGQPFRTYVGKKYKGGYSDHFPVYIKLKED